MAKEAFGSVLFNQLKLRLSVYKKDGLAPQNMHKYSQTCYFCALYVLCVYFVCVYVSI